jgi:catechol 2,3-dioxygenase-like lactoylglutathione lyase family enzyme
VFIGYHGKAGTPRSVMAHTISGAVIADVRCNGRSLGELGLNAALAAHFGVPPVLVAGDDTVAAEAADVAPGMRSVVVKQALGARAAALLHPDEACDRIEQEVPKALANRGSVPFDRCSGRLASVVMSIRWYSVVVDCRDVVAQSRWWAEVLGWRVAYQAGHEAVLVPPHALDQTRVIARSERGPGLAFVQVPDGKSLKNRLHIDLAPSPDAGQEAEVRRLEDLGASRVDIGQGEVSWVVMSDPEGNEFCVLSARD